MLKRLLSIIIVLLLIFVFSLSALAVDIEVTWNNKGSLWIEVIPSGSVVIDVPQAGNASVTIPANSLSWFFQYPKDSMNIPVTITAGTDITISGQYYLAPNIDYSTCKYTITFYDTVGNKVIYTFDVPELTGSGNKTFSATFKADRDLAKLDTYGIRYELNMATGALSEPTIFYFYACNISYLDSNEQIITAIDDQTEEIKDFFTPDIDIDSTLTDTSQIIRSQLGVLGFPSVLVNEVKTRIESTDWTQASITFPSIDFMGQHFFGPITFDFNALAQDISAINYLKTLLHLITGFICVYCCVRLAGRAISQIIGFVNPVG